MFDKKVAVQHEISSWPATVSYADDKAQSREHLTQRAFSGMDILYCQVKLQYKKSIAADKSDKLQSLYSFASITNQIQSLQYLGFNLTNDMIVFRFSQSKIFSCASSFSQPWRSNCFRHIICSMILLACRISGPGRHMASDHMNMALLKYNIASSALANFSDLVMQRVVNVCRMPISYLACLDTIQLVPTRWMPYSWWRMLKWLETTVLLFGMYC